MPKDFISYSLLKFMTMKSYSKGILKIVLGFHFAFKKAKNVCKNGTRNDSNNFQSRTSPGFESAEDRNRGLEGKILGINMKTL